MNWIKKNNFFPILSYIFFIIILLEIVGFFLWNHIKLERSFGVFQVHKAINSKEVYFLQRLKPATYGLYWNNPDFKDRTYKKQYDHNGYRNVERELNDKIPKILVLGGSTTNSYPYVPDRTKIWTSLLEKKIVKRGLKVEVYNAGLSGGTTAELLSNYLFIGRYLNPNLIILHTGANDVGPIMYADRYKYKTDYSHLRSYTGAQLRPGEKTFLRYSHFYRCLYSYWLRNGGFFRFYPKAKYKLKPEEALTSTSNNNPIAFQKNLEALVSIAKSNNSRVLFIPVNIRSKNGINKWLKENPGADNHWDAARKGMEKHKQIMEKLAVDKDIYFFELEEGLFEDEWFIDAMHLNKEGEEEKSRQIFEYLVRRNIINQAM
jgi:lysophospholipase L1-like esterase